ncbi:MAG TPA: serine protease [Vicinamibacterales bacterium]|nr:serine protease [Vicinamibacterales bacterium]
MRHAWALAALLVSPSVSSGQATSVLHVTVTLLDAAQTPVPVPRHALLVSDNPATSEPRRVMTATNGTVDIRLRPGSYTVESDRPFVFLGQAYEWTQMVDVVAGRDATLALTAENAEVVPLTESASAAAGGAASARDPSLLFGKWQESVVAIWSPTSRGSGFIVDAQGLVATDRNVVGRATSVEVQLSPTVKVSARVLSSDVSRDVAIVWIDPGVVAGRQPLTLMCPPTASLSMDDGDEIVTIAAPLRAQADMVWGEVTALNPRAIETDLRLSFGSAGGPVFNDAGALVGLTSVPADGDANRRRDVTLVRSVTICEAVAASKSGPPGAAPPEPTRLPVEPTRPYPLDELKSSTPTGSSANDPVVVSSSEFDVAFITPPTLYRASQRPDWTGGRTTRSPEAEARIGQLTEFGAWSEYFAELPPVLIVRVTPKLVEGFWKRLAREAARTQGAALPPFKDFKTDFLRLRASCGGVDLVPIHPFVLEHRVSEKDVIREGLYVFDPESLGPHCSTVTLSMYSEKAPEKADVLTIDAKAIERIWQDFASYRASAR